MSEIENTGMECLAVLHLQKHGVDGWGYAYANYYDSYPCIDTCNIINRTIEITPKGIKFLEKIKKEVWKEAEKLRTKANGRKIRMVEDLGDGFRVDGKIGSLTHEAAKYYVECGFAEYVDKRPGDVVFGSNREKGLRDKVRR